MGCARLGVSRPRVPVRVAARGRRVRGRPRRAGAARRRACVAARLSEGGAGGLGGGGEARRGGVADPSTGSGQSGRGQNARRAGGDGVRGAGGAGAGADARSAGAVGGADRANLPRRRRRRRRRRAMRTADHGLHVRERVSTDGRVRRPVRAAGRGRSPQLWRRRSGRGAGDVRGAGAAGVDGDAAGRTRAHRPARRADRVRKADRRDDGPPPRAVRSRAPVRGAYGSRARRVRRRLRPVPGSVPPLPPDRSGRGLGAARARRLGQRGRPPRDRRLSRGAADRQHGLGEAAARAGSSGGAPASSSPPPTTRRRTACRRRS